MDLIRDQGFREQRGEYGSRVGGDSLDVGVLYLKIKSTFCVTSIALSILLLTFGVRFQSLGSQ